MNLDISGLLENSNALIINPLWISRDFDVVALTLLVHLSYCVPLLTIQMLVSFHNFIKYKSLGSLSLDQHGNATFIPELEFVLPVLEAGGSKSDKKTIN